MMRIDLLLAGSNVTLTTDPYFFHGSGNGPGNGQGFGDPGNNYGHGNGDGYGEGTGNGLGFVPTDRNKGKVICYSD